MPAPKTIPADGLLKGRFGIELVFKDVPDDLHEAALDRIRERGRGELLLAVGHDSNVAIRADKTSVFRRHFPKHQAPAPRLFAVNRYHHGKAEKTSVRGHMIPQRG